MQDNVLIVDDNADIRSFVRASLEVEGYRVTEAIDGTSAINVFNSDSPSLVILDIGLVKRKTKKPFESFEGFLDYLVISLNVLPLLVF